MHSIRLLFAGLLLSLFSEARAACIGVGLTCACSVSALLLDMGNYNPLDATPTTSTGTVSVTCSSAPLNTAIVSYDIHMGAGSSGNYSNRTLVNGINTLSYNVYTESSFTTIWGNNTAGTGHRVDGYTLILNGGPHTVNYPVYTAINARQNVPPGIYSDTITVTVIF